MVHFCACAPWPPGGFSAEERLAVLTVATREIAESEFVSYIATGKYFGYYPRVLGRNLKWEGWKFRTQMYLKEVESIIEKEPEKELVLLTDCTDVFFCRPAHQLYEEFCSMGVRVVLSGEMNCSYKIQKYSKKTIKKFFRDRCKKGVYPFPNGGFVMGYAKDIATLLYANRNCEDDQVGYFNLLFENPHLLDERKIAVDNTMHLVGTLSTYPLTSSWWCKYDEKLGYHVHREFGTAPFLFHFAGENVITQMAYLRRICSCTTQSRNLSCPCNLQTFGFTGTKKTLKKVTPFLIILLSIIAMLLLYAKIYFKSK